MPNKTGQGGEYSVSSEHKVFSYRHYMTGT